MLYFFKYPFDPDRTSSRDLSLTMEIKAPTCLSKQGSGLVPQGALGSFLRQETAHLRLR